MHPQKGTLLSRNPVFRSFLFSSTVSLLGSSIFDIALPLYVWNLTHSVVDLSIVTASVNLPYFIMAPITGYLVDNGNKRLLMMVADAGSIFGLGFLSFYDALGGTNIVPIFLSAFLVKTFSIAFETITTFQLIPSLVGDDDLSRANTWFLSSLRVVQVIGPITGGIVLGTIGFQACIILNIFSFSATLFFVFKMKTLNAIIDGEGPLERNSFALSKVIESFEESVHHIRNTPLLRSFVIMMFLLNFSSLIPNTPTMTYFFSGVKQYTATEYGGVVSYIGACGILGYLIASVLFSRTKFHPSFVGSSFWQALLSTLSLAFISYPIALAALFGISRIGSSIFNMGTFLIRQTAVPKKRMGSVNTTLRMFFMLASPISAVIQGWMIKHLGIEAAFVGGALCMWGTHHYSKEVGKFYEAHEAHQRVSPKVKSKAA